MATNAAGCWQALAQTKQQSILNSIPEKWRISTLPAPAELPDCTGGYIQQYLTPREIEITEADAVFITEQTTSGGWSSVQVAEAFCHRAALAHQMV